MSRRANFGKQKQVTLLTEEICESLGSKLFSTESKKQGQRESKKTLTLRILEASSHWPSFGANYGQVFI